MDESIEQVSKTEADFYTPPSKFSYYKQKVTFHCRPVVQADLDEWEEEEAITYVHGYGRYTVTISQMDVRRGSPKLGDVICYRSDSHRHQFLIPKETFEKQYEEV